MIPFQANKYSLYLIDQEGNSVGYKIPNKLNAGDFVMFGENNNGWVNFFGANVATVYEGDFRYYRVSYLDSYNQDYKAHMFVLGFGGMEGKLILTNKMTFRMEIQFL